MRNRSGAAGGRGTRQGRLERLLFSVMGPPQLGDASAPVPTPSDPAVTRCPTCRASWDDHAVVRTATRTYLTCPDVADGRATAGETS